LADFNECSTSHQEQLEYQQNLCKNELAQQKQTLVKQLHAYIDELWLPKMTILHFWAVASSTPGQGVF